VSTPDELRGRIREQFGDGIPERSYRDGEVPIVGARPIECSEQDDARLEKQIEFAGDKQLKALGFEVVKFSHPGKTKQTPGIADRRYYHRARRICFWWEAKSATGRQRPDQALFQEMCDAVGDPYCLGTDADLFTWLLARYPLVRDEQGHLIWRGE
jgi:hypothetical protein